MSGILDIGTLLGHMDLDVGPFQESLENADKKLGDAGGKMSASAKLIGAGIGAAIAFSLADAMNAEAANKKLAQQLGLNEAESAKLGKTAGQLYAQNYGESLEQVNEALGAVVRNVDGMSTASEAELQRVTGRVLNLSAAFGVDLAESTRTVGVLMKTGMAKDATEALDLITKGLQSPVNAADDLLDTFDEYSTVFRSLGLDGRDALGLLQQGLQGGARDADQIADSLKELLLRVQAGDANGGLRAIGLDADAMRTALQSGGETARDATDKIITAFTGVRDPADRAQIALALFGTKAEDAQKALDVLDLKSAATDFEALNGPIDGASAGMDKLAGEGRQAGFDKLMRSVQGAATTFGTALLPAVDLVLTGLSGLLTIVESVVGWFTDLPPGVQIAIGALIALKLAVGGVGQAIAAAFKANPIGLAVTAAVAALSFLVGAFSDAEGAATDLSGAIDEQTGKFRENAEATITASLAQSGLLEKLAAAGVPTGLATKAIMERGAALEELQSILADNVTAEQAAADAASYFTENGKITPNTDGLVAANQLVADFGATVGEVASKQAAGAQAAKEYDAAFRLSPEAAQSYTKAGDAISAARDAMGSGTSVAAGWSKTVAGTAVDMDALNSATAAAAEPISAMEFLFNSVDDAASDADNSVKFFNISVNEMLGINTSAQQAEKLLNDAIRSTKQAFDDATAATNGNVESLVKANGQIDTTTQAGSDLYDNLQDIANAYDVSTTAAYDNAIQSGDTAGALGKAREAADAARAKFLEQADALGISDEAARLLADGLGIVEGTKLTDKNFAVNAEGLVDAQTGLDLINATTLAPKVLQVTAQVTGATNQLLSNLGLGFLHAAAGGAVTAPGPKGVDSIPYLLAHGEHVLNDKNVDALGGQGNVYALRNALDIGGLAAAARFLDSLAGHATGGPTAAATAPTAVMTAPEASKRQIAEYLEIHTQDPNVGQVMDKLLFDLAWGSGG